MRKIFAVCLLVLAMSAGLYAQALSSITGTVTDATGAVVPNAKVTITNTATQVAKNTVTSSAGTYTVTDLIPGNYTVQVAIAGFQTAVHNGVLVDVGRPSTVDVALQTGAVTQSVEVVENVITLNTTDPELGTTIENKVVQNLPIELDEGDGRGRQIDSLMFLVPGVTGGGFSKRINGGVDFESEVVFNGIPMAQSETQGFQTIWNPPFEQVNEFNVLRSSFSAQYGLAAGVATYQTASGTNDFHGDGFEILRNNFFDARGAYNSTVPVDNENNYGFTIGGPVLIPKLYNGKNRTFFHFNMEWYRRNTPDLTFMSLPTAAEKAGNFNGVATIYDPTTGNPFPNNTIPQSRFSALSSSLIPLMPNPTFSGYVNNFQSNEGVLPTRQRPWGFNIDHAINDKQSIHWSEWRDPQTSYATETGSHLLGELGSETRNPDLGTVFIVNYSYSITPHLVMTAGASWLGELNDQISLSKNASFAADPGSPQLAAINFSGPLSPTTLGSPWIESINRKLGWVIENNYLWIKGKHTFNIGWETRRTYQDDNECQRCAGNFNFSNNETANPANLTDGSGNAFASFLLGTVDSANRYGTNELRLRNRDVSGYIQDDIKLRPNLTVNVGVRYDVMVPFTEVNNLIVYFNSQIPNPAADGIPGAVTKFGNCTGCAGLDRASIHWNHVSPRVGFSYGLNNKTVIQGGFAQNYLDGGAYEYGTHKVAVNYGNLLDGSFQRASTGGTTPGFGSWDSNFLPLPGIVPFSPGLGVGTDVNAFNPAQDGRAPYVLAWNLGIQRELPYNMLMTAAYVGNRGNFLPSALNPINQLDPQLLSYGSLLGLPVTSPQAVAAGIKVPYANFLNQLGSSASVLQALMPYPQYPYGGGGIFNNFDDTGSSLYRALQVTVEKRYTTGLSFLVSYSLSKMMSNTESGFTSFANTDYNKNNQKAQWTIDNNDQTNVISIATTYELPIGKGKQFLSNHGLASNVIGGWVISPVLQYSTGTPLLSGTGGSVYAPGDPLGNGCAPCNRVNVVPGVTQQFSYSNVYKGLPVLNAAAFTAPGLWTLGTEPRVIPIRLPWNLNENVSLSKRFFLAERISAELRFSYFNLFNRVVFGGPDLGIADPNFGLVINSQANTQRQGQAQFTVRF